jgi:hypothetical protein
VNCATLAAIIAGPCLAIGWYGHAWWVRSALRKRVAEMSNERKVNWVTVSYYVMVIAIVGSIFYNDYRTETKVSESESRQIDTTASQMACLSRTFEEFLTGNQILRDASARRDDALLGSKRALRELIRLRVIDQIDDSEAVRQAADQYMVQTQNFINASMELTEARKDYKLPDFEKECGEIPPEFKGSLYGERYTGPPFKQG